jgi:hypothetical protein
VKLVNRPRGLTRADKSGPLSKGSSISGPAELDVISRPTGSPDVNERFKRMWTAEEALTALSDRA